MIQPGERGVYVTCPRRKEPQAGKEFKQILAEFINTYYPEVKPDVEENPEPAGDIEDEIAKEVAEMKASKREKMFSQIQLNAESLLFFKLKAPIVPSFLVERICSDLLESGEKKGRFIQRIVAVDASCTSDKAQWTQMLREKLDSYLESNQLAGKKYMVNLTRRHFETFDRDQIEEHVKEVMTDLGFEHRYKDVDLVINVYCFKSNMGISLIKYDDFQKYCKLNLQMIYDAANGLEEALGRKKSGAVAEDEPKQDTE